VGRYNLHGYEDGEIEACHSAFKAAAHPGDSKRIQEGYRALFENRVPFDVEFRLRMKSGEYRWFRGRGQALWNDEGRPVRMSGSIRDITERKQSEAKLRQAQKLNPSVRWLAA